MKNSAISITLLAIALSLAAVGCGGGAGGDISGIDPKTRFVNAFPGVTSAKAAMGSVVLGDDIAYGTSSDYGSTNNERKDLTAGESSFDDLATLADEVYSNNHRYTGVGFGTAGNRTIVRLDSNRDDAPSHKVSLRLFDAISGPGSVDVYFTLASAGNNLPGSPSIAGVVRGTVSNYYNLEVGSESTVNVRVRVFAAGDRQTPLEDRTLNLVANYRGTAIAMDPGADNLPLFLRDNL